VTLSETAVINYSVYWLSWNAPEDPPFLFFNPHFSTAITEERVQQQLPQRFPGDPSESEQPCGHAVRGGRGQPECGVAAVGARNATRGACVLFPAENIRAHVITVCNAHGASGFSNVVPYYWRLNPTRHSTLANTNYTHRAARNGRAGEILATPAPPTNPEDTETYGSDCVVAYRYKNIFWLPHTARNIQDTANLRYDFRLVQPYLFWLLYGLQVAGVRPRYKLPVQMETDHPIESAANTPPFNLSYRQQMEALLAKHDYMREFARRTGTAIIHGVRVGGRHRTTSPSYHWQMMYGTGIPDDARAVAQQINQLLVAGHREGTTPCGVHDHTAGNFQGGYWLGDVRAILPSAQRDALRRTCGCAD
jgi:hypothetical protein